MWRYLLLALAVLASACIGPTDDASQVHDLRVLGISFDPPELMANRCDSDALSALAFVRPIKMKTLIADPAGEGREITYTITACANVGDRKCENENDFAELAAGTTGPGVLVNTLLPAATLLPDATPLLAETVSQDTYKGLGGVRVPFVVKLTAGDEILYAQKLMLFSCRFFPDQKVNVAPVLPGMTLDGQDWAEGQVRTLSGDSKFVVEPPDVSALEEDYVVPSFSLKPISLHESWKIAWHTTSGKFSSTETGGTDFAGQPERHRVEWNRDPEVTEERDITFYFVVRDGRGGLSWLIRQAHWLPP